MLKTINIKGKEYVQVHTRILEFHKLYPGGSITTDYEFFPDQNMWVVKATVTITKKEEGKVPVTNTYTGLAQEIIGEGYINKTSALENAETSAVGRALGMLGIGIEAGMASADEVEKAQDRSEYMDKFDPLYVLGCYDDREKVKKLPGAKYIGEKKAWQVYDTPDNRSMLYYVKASQVLDKNGEAIALQEPEVDINPPF